MTIIRDKSEIIADATWNEYFQVLFEFHFSEQGKNRITHQRFIFSGYTQFNPDTVSSHS
jgi:hypothetical protein